VEIYFTKPRSSSPLSALFSLSYARFSPAASASVAGVAALEKAVGRFSAAGWIWSVIPASGKSSVAAACSIPASRPRLGRRPYCLSSDLISDILTKCQQGTLTKWKTWCINKGDYRNNWKPWPCQRKSRWISWKPNMRSVKSPVTRKTLSRGWSTWSKCLIKTCSRPTGSTRQMKWRKTSER